MERSKETFQKIREKMIVTVYKDYYEQHYDIFKPPNTEIKSIYVEGEDHTKDDIHKGLLKKYMKAQKDLRDYEYDIRHNNQ